MINSELVIGVIRPKYTILSATHPTDSVSSKDCATVLDKIVLVACSLTNLCDSVCHLNKVM